MDLYFTSNIPIEGFVHLQGLWLFSQVYNYGIMRIHVLHGTSEPLKIGQ